MELDEIKTKLILDINKYSIDAYGQQFNNRLGASVIGNECKRALWYGFRWFTKNPADPRMLRLGQRGNLEEARFIEYLRGIGCQVWAFAPKVLHFNSEAGMYWTGAEFYNKGSEDIIENVTDDPAHIRCAELQGVSMKPEQYAMTGVMGHLGGKLDGIVMLPPHYGIQVPFLLEGKTHGTGAGFNKVMEKGFKAAKPEHYTQNSLYGYKYGIEYVIYMCANKNDDSLHVEVEKLDWELGKTAEAKAEFIIMAKEPPPKVSAKPDSPKCASCNHKAVCHEGAQPERNCRSCKHASPVENQQWYCAVHNDNIPKEYIPQACGSYESIV